MKIVVTGALGHIGSRVIRDLPQYFENAEIVMIDNMKTQRYPSLFNLSEKTRYHFIEGDVTTLDLESFISGAEVVIHLAAETDAAGSFGRAEEVEKGNFNATKCVAQACAKLDVPMIHASSTSVYGSQHQVVDESCGLDDLKPQSPYAHTKLREESLITEMCLKEGLRAVTFRFGTIFGTSPGMRFHTAVNKFCWQAVMGQPLTVWATAYDQKRPYLDLIDAVRAMAFAIERKLFSGTIYNALTLNATVRQVVDAIRLHVPSLEVHFVNNQIMNQLSYEVLNSRLAKEGFHISGDLEKGILDSVRFLRNANYGK
jgi:nucleoside-diphosphate-sugar epimerase